MTTPARLSAVYFLAITCSIISIPLPTDKLKAPAYRHLIAIAAAFLIRYWLLSAGQTT